MEQSNHSYETVSEAMDSLAKRGYTIDFLLESEKEHLTHPESSLSLSPEDFEIDEIHRFEGMSDPADETVIFAISSKQGNVKGTVINSYGADFGFRASKLVEYLNSHL